MYHTQQVSLVSRLNSGISGNEDVSFVRAINAGSNPNNTFENIPVSGVDNANSSTVTLGISALFTGAWTDVSLFHGISVLVDGTSAGTADGTLRMKFSHDGVTDHRVISITISDVTAAAPRTLGVVARYFKVEYQNGTTAMTSFDLQTMYHTQQVSLVSRLDGTLSSDADVSNVRAVSVGQDPHGDFVNLSADGYAFVTQLPLTVGDLGLTYTSEKLDARGYTQVQTSIKSDIDGLMTFEFYGMSTDPTPTRTISLRYTASTGFQLFSAPTFTCCVRYIFTSDSDQSEFYFSTKFTTKSISGQVLTTVAPISTQMVANLGRNILVGQDSVGTFHNVPVDTKGDLMTRISDPLTAFGDLRNAELTPIIQLVFPYNINTELVTISSVDTGSATQSEAMIVLQTGVGAAGSSMMMSRQVVKFHSGQGTLCRFAALFTIGVANSEQLLGLGDVDNGFNIGYNGAQFGVMIKRGGVENWTSQSNWNIDVMDGTGVNNPSHMLLDHSKLNGYEIQFQGIVLDQ